MAALSSSIAAARRISGRAASVSTRGDSRAQEVWRSSVRPLSCGRVLLSLAVEYQKRDARMKTTLLAALSTALLTQALWAQQARPAPGHPWKIGSRPRPREPNQKSSYRYLPEKTASVQSFCVMNRRTILQGALFTLGASTIERSLVARGAGLSRGAGTSSSTSRCWARRS